MLELIYRNIETIADIVRRVYLPTGFLRFPVRNGNEISVTFAAARAFAVPGNFIPPSPSLSLC